MDQALAHARLAALSAASFLPGHSDKGFVKRLAKRTPAEFSERQATHLEFLAWTYRRQLPPALVPPANPYP